MWIKFGEREPINLDNIISFKGQGRQKSNPKYTYGDLHRSPYITIPSIKFSTVARTKIYWEFETKDERDKYIKAIETIIITST